MKSRSLGAAAAGFVVLGLVGLGVLLVIVTSGDAGSLARDRPLLDGVDAEIARLAPGQPCAQLDAVLAAVNAAAGALEKVRARPVAAFAGLIGDRRASCAAAAGGTLGAGTKDFLVTTWSTVRVAMGRSGESLSGGVPAKP
jgi:hypothetical protein